MHPFGEMAIVSYGSSKVKMQSKLKNRGRPCIHLSISEDRPSGTYRFFDIQTRKIINSRDVRWLGVYYGDYMKLPKNERSYLPPDSDSESESSGDPKSQESEVSSLQSASAMESLI
jgi:hypothetical protein